ncbi:sigma-70 family RNA polymerase sigma factor (plasmid) [Deinococcus sp. KNUC1210]|uniref:RNA polymerase sigma factor n=1 Tax=Deinococcus sp. KNUC1210 TaxID=2917691 RepID=UPI001EEFC46E|nr:sigma-70 family RNA polymerase sigma factor [Deinococcus sp. KNUC1210]ULH17855.1 sigma-70 family RNA polymerase sigma factor [Deinococcus sp. KNUC1210]
MTSSGPRPSTSPDTAHQRLIVQLRHGQDDALKELYDDLSGVTYRVCLRMLSTPEDAEEALQDTFVRLADRADVCDPSRGTVRTFVLTIAHHLCLERLRTRRSRPVRDHDREGEEAFDLPSRAARDPLDEALVQSALTGLPGPDRALLEAMFFGGYTHAEITTRTGLPLGTVKSRLRRALLKLRERMLP